MTLLLWNRRHQESPTSLSQVGKRYSETKWARERERKEVGKIKYKHKVKEETFIKKAIEKITDTI